MAPPGNSEHRSTVRAVLDASWVHNELGGATRRQCIALWRNARLKGYVQKAELSHIQGTFACSPESRWHHRQHSAEAVQDVQQTKVSTIVHRSRDLCSRNSGTVGGPKGSALLQHYSFLQFRPTAGCTGHLNCARIVDEHGCVCFALWAFRLLRVGHATRPLDVLL